MTMEAITGQAVFDLADRASLLKAYELVIEDMDKRCQYWAKKADQYAAAVDMPQRESEPFGLRVQRREEARRVANDHAEIVMALHRRLVILGTSAH